MALVALNLVAPAAFVAARNVERVIDPALVAARRPAGLDAEYLGVLPDDAIPVLVAALPALPAPERRAVLAILGPQGRAGDGSGVREPGAWNLGRERARAALATLP